MKPEAILIPGGGLTEAGEPPPWVANRLDRALVLQGDACIVLLSAGTPHKPPPLDAHGFPILESAASARYLLGKGANPASLLVESCSLDTIGNAYFSLAVHMIPRDFRRLLVITSQFHMARTEMLFRWIYDLHRPGFYDLRFESVPDTGIGEGALRARAAKEADALTEARRLEENLRTPAAFHRWLFTEHAAYAAGHTRPSGAGEALGTY